MKEPFETKKQGVVHTQTETIRKDLRKRVKAETARQRGIKIERNSALRKFIDKRVKAFHWFEKNVPVGMNTELACVNCPLCKKSVSISKTPVGAIAWVDKNETPWSPHKCAHDRTLPSARFTEVELKHTKELNDAYVNLRNQIDWKAK